MPQDPDSLIPNIDKFAAFRKQRHMPGPDLPPRLEGDELVAWVTSGLNIQYAVKQHEALGLAALRRRGLSLEEWQIDPDGHIMPRQSGPNSSGTTPQHEPAEPTPHPDH